MGLLDKKERILDVVLTDRGRDLFSKNQLQIKYFAFSDEGIDYSGSLSASVSVSSGSTYDEIIYNTLTFEADQRIGDQTLKTFLFNGPVGSKVSLQFVTNRDANPEITLERRYEIIKFKEINKVQENKPVIVRVDQKRNYSQKNRQLNYLYNQRISQMIDVFKTIKK